MDMHYAAKVVSTDAAAVNLKDTYVNNLDR